MKANSHPEGLPSLIPARMLNEYVYCPRLFYLEWVAQEFEESADTIEGHMKHRTVDVERGSLPLAEDGDELTALHARSVLLSGQKCGCIARIDIIEGTCAETIPVDYKKGTKPNIPEGAWLPDRIQLCAQALILRENGYVCDEGALYYIGSKARVTIQITSELIEKTLSAIDECRGVAACGKIPDPLKESEKCPRCSLAGICLPDEVTLLKSSSEMGESEAIPASILHVMMHFRHMSPNKERSSQSRAMNCL